MFEEVLSKKTRQYLAILGKNGLLEKAYLAGGTALALRIGHRISVDLDFFTGAKFDSKDVILKLSRLPVDFRSDRSAAGTILGHLGNTRFSLFFYDYFLLEKTDRFLNVDVAGFKDITAMKISAIADRGTKRDFIDLYFIAAVEKIIGLEGALELYDRKFKVLHQNKFHTLKNLAYFGDAEKDEMPTMIKKVGWTTVKKFFEKEVRGLTKKLISR